MKPLAIFFQQFVSKYKAMSIQKKATLWFVLSSFVQRGLSFLVTPIFTRLMTVSEFGQFNEFLSWQSILTVIVTLNLPWGVFEQGLIKFDAKRKIFTSSLEWLLLIFVLIWGTIYISFQDFFNTIFSLSTNEMLSMLVLMWTSSIFSFWAATERVEYKYVRIVLLTIFISILKPVLGILFIKLLEDNVEARILSLVVSEIICYIPLFILHIREGQGNFSKSFCAYAIKFNILLVPHYLSQMVLNSSDRIMIGRMVSSEAAGLYSLAYSLSSILLIFNTSLLQALNPLVFSKIKEEKYQEISRLTFPSLVLVGLLNILLMIFAPEIVTFFAPKEYYDAIWVIPPVSLSVFFMYMYSLFSTIEFYFEKTKFISLATTIGAVLNLVLNYFFINWFGYIAAGYTTLVCYIFYAICHYLVMRFSCLNNNIEVYKLRSLLWVSAVFILATGTIIFTYNYQLVRYTFIVLSLMLMIVFYKKIYQFVKSLMIMNAEKEIK